ncbi:MAG: hypothetical protein M1820_006696 [Bogoriella megaspora]|nr:MAG: hypothetical protein M1820_006696 [Bogoriella megaspora]
MARNTGTYEPSYPTDRRSSTGTQKFSNLNDLKRNSNPEAFAARRASLTEQTTAKPGFLGTMWHNFTRGPGSLEKK